MTESVTRLDQWRTDAVLVEMPGRATGRRRKLCSEAHSDRSHICRAETARSDVVQELLSAFAALTKLEEPRAFAACSGDRHHHGHRQCGADGSWLASIVSSNPSDGSSSRPTPPTPSRSSEPCIDRCDARVGAHVLVLRRVEQRCSTTSPSKPRCRWRRRGGSRAPRSGSLADAGALDMSRRPADYVRTSMSEERVARIWRGVGRFEERACRRTTRLRFAGAVGVAALGAFAVWGVARLGGGEVATSNGVQHLAEASVDDRTMSLPDGTSLSQEHPRAWTSSQSGRALRGQPRSRQRRRRRPSPTEGLAVVQAHGFLIETRSPVPRGATGGGEET